MQTHTQYDYEKHTVSSVNSREDDFYSEVLRSKVVNESHFESSLNEYHLINYDWDVIFSKRHVHSKFELTTQELATEIDTARKEVKTIRLNLKLLFKVEFPQDGTTEWFLYDDSISSLSNALVECLRATTNNHPVDLEMTDTGVRVTPDEETDSIALTEVPEDYWTEIGVDKNTLGKPHPISEYLILEGEEAPAQIKSLHKTDDGAAVIPISIRNAELTIEYQTPESSDSSFWTLVEQCGGDPLAIEQMYCTLNLRPFTQTPLEESITGKSWMITNISRNSFETPNKTRPDNQSQNTPENSEHTKETTRLSTRIRNTVKETVL